MDNYYHILGIDDNATEVEIKSQYKRLAKAYHPDVNASKGAEEKFKLISVAYRILIRPELRYKHDIQIAADKLRTAQVKSQNYQYKHNPWNPPTPQKSSNNPPTYVDYAMERKGTLYAFVFIGIIAFVLYVGVSIYELYHETKEENLISAFDEQIIIADSLYYAGKVQAAISFIKEIKASETKNYTLKRYEMNYLNFRKKQADIDYKNNAYKDALWGYLFFMEYSGEQNLDMLFHVANCYRGINEPNKAIFILNNLLDQNYNRLPTIYLIAKIYKDDLKEYDLALDYYKMGVYNIELLFKNLYGEAYRLLVSAERTPPLYKTIYFETAELLVTDQQYSKAKKLLEWVLFFEPDNVKAYQYLYISYFYLAEPKLACNTLSRAHKKGFRIADEYHLNCI